MPHRTIARELHIDAPPEVVFEVISSPAHIRDWWRAATDIEPVAGSAGTLTWGTGEAEGGKVVPITVVEARPSRRFSFRWAYDPAEPPTPANSLLVTFDLHPADGGTLLRFSETGFGDRGWAEEELEASYRDHARGWETFLPRLAARAAQELSAT